MNPAFLIPRSNCAGVVWPALSDDFGARTLALQYQLQQSQWWPEERILAFQLQQFSMIFRHALETVSYYRDRFAPWASGIVDWGQYQELPISTRYDVQQAGDALHSNAPPPAHGRLLTTESSGSTGNPLITRGNEWTQLLWQAFLLRDHIWHRRDFSGKLAAIRSVTGEVRLPAWGPATAAYVTGECVVRGLSFDIDEQLQWLVKENPDYLIAHAMNVQALAERSFELGISLPRLKQARTYGEMLRPDARDVVRKAWNIGIVDSYSCEELGYLALQCPDCDDFHVQSEGVILEVIGTDGRRCRPGEIGRVVLSSLQNFAMPLLRYANGDYAEVGERCACGRGLPVLRRIVGRQRNMLVRPDGVRHWPSFPSQVWRSVAPVVQIQLVQDAVDHIIARIVLKRELERGEGGRLTAALQQCLGYPFRITLQRVDVITQNPGQKFEDFISLVST